MLMVPSFLKSKIFELVVRFTLGWNYFPPDLDSSKSLWFSVLGQADFEKLPKMAKKYHGRAGKGGGAGICAITRDDNIFLNLVATIYGLPKPKEDCKFEAFTESDARTATWIRVFDGKLFSSKMMIKNGQLIEKFGLFSYAIQVNVDPKKNTIFYESTDCWVLGVKISKIFRMESRWKEEGTEAGWNFDGEMTSIFGKVFGYKGSFLVKQFPTE
eukprot:TRINITY_DN4802_c0_g1_i1.p1 TRINITY_DN4802_c0_g1~~TRINITY_DN4802_c0_g1_i1.p1  ORF type:complete len:214 (-),score=33.49 TRINITY_DN4802_c0_g1_i1:34-675(-)